MNLIPQSMLWVRSASIARNLVRGGLQRVGQSMQHQIASPKRRFHKLATLRLLAFPQDSTHGLTLDLPHIARAAFRPPAVRLDGSQSTVNHGSSIFILHITNQCRIANIKMRLGDDNKVHLLTRAFFSLLLVRVVVIIPAASHAW